MTDRFTRPSRKAFLKLAAVAGVSAAFALPTQAQTAASAAAATDWPTKPVRIITPFPVGSGPEGVVRLLAEKLQKTWASRSSSRTGPVPTASSPSMPSARAPRTAMT